MKWVALASEQCSFPDSLYICVNSALTIHNQKDEPQIWKWLSSPRTLPGIWMPSTNIQNTGWKSHLFYKKIINKLINKKSLDSANPQNNHCQKWGLFLRMNTFLSLKSLQIDLKESTFLSETLQSSQFNSPTISITPPPHTHLIVLYLNMTLPFLVEQELWKQFAF